MDELAVALLSVLFLGIAIGGFAVRWQSGCW
jgi:hypothetical protein